MDDLTPTEVHAVAAKQAIRDALASYCRSMDRMDRDLALATWHADGTCEYVDMFEGTGAGFVDWVWGMHEGMIRHSHQITNVLMEVDVEGDRAVSEAYVTVALWSPPEDSPTEIISRALPRPVVVPRRSVGHRPPPVRAGPDDDDPDSGELTGGRGRPVAPRPRRSVVHALRIPLNAHSTSSGRFRAQRIGCFDFRFASFSSMPRRSGTRRDWRRPAPRRSAPRAR